MRVSLSMERELRNLTRTGRYVLGAKQTLKLLRHAQVKLVIMAKNTPPEVRDRVKYYARLGGVPILEFDGTSDELGHTLGKPFVVSVIGVVEEGASRILELAG